MSQLKFFNKGVSTTQKGLILLLVLLLFAAGVVVYWYYFINNPDWKVMSLEEWGIDLPKDKTANWKTYRNEEHSFEFKYPKDWKLNHESSKVVEIASVGRDQYLHGVGVPPKGNAWIIFYPSLSTNSALSKNFSEGKRELEVFPHESIIVEQEILSGNIQVGISKGYWKNGDSGFEQLVDQILSTFRFLE